MHNWNKSYWAPEIYQLITCSCHLSLSEKWAGRKKYRQTWMIHTGKIPSATRYLGDCSFLPETHIELQGPRQMRQPFPNLAVSFPSSCPWYGWLGLGATDPQAAQPWLSITPAMRCGGGWLLSYNPLPRLQQDNAVIGCSPASPPFDTIVLTKILQCYVLAAHEISALAACVGSYNVSDSFLPQSFHLLDRFGHYVSSYPFKWNSLCTILSLSPLKSWLKESLDHHLPLAKEAGLWEQVTGSPCPQRHWNYLLAGFTFFRLQQRCCD